MRNHPGRGRGLLGTININRPEARNALSKTVLREIRAALEDFAVREDVHL
ncbi:hypothetical protein KKR91_07910 [Arthrobacter jiangjiafuii]|uniref:Enoyl-CoA hydratase n=1 Tax=Arthrobacter jiangjiafuii TaxID=2817475 RepID=A0A975M7L2_9MICC|nr:hypothetical protein [Arthrobacter jiangjiafuii]MBP3042929.1 hypothetical protein [Arthrobacter jiangjiafuii]QWC11458.1 hypothetical protein KKR91_07910 [Arthrobacter jiangjiafuii]